MSETTLHLSPLYTVRGLVPRCVACDTEVPRPPFGEQTRWVLFQAAKSGTAHSQIFCDSCASAKHPEWVELAARVTQLNLPRVANPVAIVSGEEIGNDECRRPETCDQPSSRRPFEMSRGFGWGRRPLSRCHAHWDELEPRINALLDGREVPPPYLPPAPLPPREPTKEEVYEAERAEIVAIISRLLPGRDTAAAVLVEQIQKLIKLERFAED